MLLTSNYSEAISAFQESNFVFPNRTLTLVGLARSYAGLKNIKEACNYYSLLIYQLKNCDIGFSLYDESESYVIDNCNKKDR